MKKRHTAENRPDLTHPLYPAPHFCHSCNSHSARPSPCKPRQLGPSRGPVRPPFTLHNRPQPAATHTPDAHIYKAGAMKKRAPSSANTSECNESVASTHRSRGTPLSRNTARSPSSCASSTTRDHTTTIVLRPSSGSKSRKQTSAGGAASKVCVYSANRHRRGFSWEQVDYTSGDAPRKVLGSTSGSVSFGTTAATSAISSPVATPLVFLGEQEVSFSNAYVQGLVAGSGAHRRTKHGSYALGLIEKLSLDMKYYKETREEIKRAS